MQVSHPRDEGIIKAESLLQDLLRLAREAANALQKHCSSRTGTLLPYVADNSPNGLLKLAERLRQQQSCATSAGEESEEGHLGNEDLPRTGPPGQGSDQPRDPNPDVMENNAGAASQREQSTHQIDRILCSSDPMKGAKLRLRARLHLEVLRVLDWCFCMLGRENVQQVS